MLLCQRRIELNSQTLLHRKVLVCQSRALLYLASLSAICTISNPSEYDNDSSESLAISLTDRDDAALTLRKDTRLIISSL